MYIPATCDDRFSAVCVVVLGCEELAGAVAVPVTGTVWEQYVTMRYHQWKML